MKNLAPADVLKTGLRQKLGQTISLSCSAKHRLKITKLPLTQNRSSVNREILTWFSQCKVNFWLKITNCIPLHIQNMCKHQRIEGTYLIYSFLTVCLLLQIILVTDRHIPSMYLKKNSCLKLFLLM